MVIQIVIYILFDIFGPPKIHLILLEKEKLLYSASRQDARTLFLSNNAVWVFGTQTRNFSPLIWGYFSRTLDGNQKVYFSTSKTQIGKKID